MRQIGATQASAACTSRRRPSPPLHGPHRPEPVARAASSDVRRSLSAGPSAVAPAVAANVRHAAARSAPIRSPPASCCRRTAGRASARRSCSTRPAYVARRRRTCASERRRPASSTRVERRRRRTRPASRVAVQTSSSGGSVEVVGARSPPRSSTRVDRDLEAIAATAPRRRARAAISDRCSDRAERRSSASMPECARFRPPARLASGAIVDARLRGHALRVRRGRAGWPRELGCSHVLAQVLVRRGLGEPEAARAFLAAADAHPLEAWPGCATAAARILGHVERGSRITVHGDYDVDGICSTGDPRPRAAHARRRRRLVSAEPDRRRLRARARRRSSGSPRAARELLITVDCAVTAVEEVARARAPGMDVVVTDHHSRARTACCPTRRSCTRGSTATRARTCARRASRTSSRRRCWPRAGEDPRAGRRGPRPRRAGDGRRRRAAAGREPAAGARRACARSPSTRKVGLRALMDVARVDPSGLDEGAIGFRLGPRLNAAGRLYRADAGLELLLTEDRERARAVAAELDAVNTERRDVETRIRFEAEALVAEQPRGQRASCSPSEGWHPGVIGIVAVADRRAPPPAGGPDRARRRGGQRLGPLDPGASTCSAACTRARGHLLRYGGHRAAAGLTIAARRGRRLPRGVPRARRERARARGPACPRCAIDAVAQGDALSLDLAEELQQLAPFGAGQPGRLAARPGRAADRPARDGGGPPRRVHAQRRRRPLALRAFGDGARCPVEPGRARRRRRAAGDRPLQRRRRRRGSSCARPTVPRRAPIDVLGEPEFAAAGCCASWTATWPRRGAPAGRERPRAHPRSAAAPASPACSPTSSPPASRCWP